ncbi:MAG: SusC/RagA family TonB-linked outer membrane protein [Gemmatimonadota bacterium]
MFVLVGAAAALALTAGTASAQSAVFSGTVTSAGSPLGGATVAIPELGVGAITSQDGKYSFTVDIAKAGGAGRSVTVMARFIGYKPKRMPVKLAAGRMPKDFELDKDILSLDQVVVTGVSDATSQRKTAFTVSVVDATAIKEVPFTSAAASLSGKVAGASVLTTSAQPGDEPAIRLRAATSLTGRQDPLVIVDGTITRLGLADINSQDIERMEVIKGAAASSLYGSDAANGVVQIFTKRGANLAEGQTVVQVRNDYGNSVLPHAVAGNMSHNYQLNADGSFKLDAKGNRTPELDKISDNPYPVYYDQLGEVFKPGTAMNNYVSVGQRRGNLNYNASFENTKETGVLNLLNGFSRQNMRINLDQSMSDKLDYQVGAFYGRSHGDQAEGAADIFFGLTFLEPNVNLTAKNKDGSPYNAAIKQAPLSGNVSNPLYRLYNASVTNDRDRFSGNLKVRFKPLAWLTAEGNVNYDQLAGNYKSFRPTGFLNSSGVADKGGLSQSASSNRTTNMGATVTSVRNYKDWFTNTTKLAWVFEDQSSNSVSVTATALTVPQVMEFTAASKDPANPVLPGSHSETIRNQNFFAVTTFDIKDRYILDGLIRQDQSSLFGMDSRSALYNRFSVAYRVTEDVKIPGVDEFKLRASRGTAGLRPQFNAQYEVFSVAGGSPEKITLGNPLLKPAFSTETEYGLNINFLTNYTLEYSYSDKSTSDQILSVPLSAAAGYRNQWRNAGTLAGQTHEIAFGAVLASSKDFFWRLNVTADRTRQKITELNVPPFLVGPDGNTRIFRIAEGQKFGVIFGSRWIRTPEQLAATLKSGILKGAASDYKVNEDGYYVRAAQHHTVNEVPLKAYDEKGESLTEIGDVNPDFNMGISNTVQWKGVTVAAQFNWVKGGEIYNYTRQWPFNELRDPVIDQRGKPEAEKKPTTYYSAFYNNFDANDYFVENGTYLRLRELAVSAQVPKAWMAKVYGLSQFSSARIGVVGQNLWTSTNYLGYDPDVSGPGGNPFAYRVDYFTYPSYRTVKFMLDLNY